MKEKNNILPVDFLKQYYVAFGVNKVHLKINFKRQEKNPNFSFNSLLEFLRACGVPKHFLFHI